MEKVELIKKLGLPEDATDEQVSAAMDAAIEKAITPAPAPGPDLTPPQQFEIMKRVDTETRLKAIHRKSAEDDEEKRIAKALDYLLVSRIGTEGVDMGGGLAAKFGGKQGTEEIMKAALGVTSTNWMPNTFSTQWFGEMLEESILRIVPTTLLSGAAMQAPVRPLVQRGVSFVDGGDIATETSDPTASVTLTPKPFGLRRGVSDRFNGAANPVAAAQEVSDWLRQSMAFTLDDVLINGDTAATHQDGETNDVRNNILGIRANAVDNGVTADLSTFSIATIEGLLLKMANYGIDGENLYLIAGYKVLSKLRTLGGTDNQWRYVNGDNPKNPDTVGGNKVIRCSWTGLNEYVTGSQSCVRNDLNASGVYDGVTTTYTCLPIINSRGWVAGFYPDDMLLKAPMTDTGMRLALSTFAAITPVRSTQPTAAMGYKIS